MAQISCKRLKYIKNGFTMLEMAQELEELLKNVGNGSDMWETA